MAERVGASASTGSFPGPVVDESGSTAQPAAASAQTEAEAIQLLYQELLGKTSHYLQSEFEVTAEDYRLLQHMNNVTKGKYEDLMATAKHVKGSLRTMNDRSTCVKPFLERIDQVEAQVNDLERSIFRLDTYAKQLGK